ncbi:MAG: type IV toxin-antitoxin system AbiEi family antitoxin [Endomicrobium sp.]|jgi:hypothetical protein|nr:type IV toxin-antitoxin system AbiEi family antitoxin [Endomicrobium sp.]
MNSQPKTFLNQILEKIPANTVALSSWLREQGISKSLQNVYKKHFWLKSIGQGAFIKFSSDKATLNGAIYALQQQANLKIHIGALFALTLNGKAHYVRFKNTYHLFTDKKTTIPKWFAQYHFDEDKWKIYKTSFLPADIGLTDYNVGNYTIKISSPERAILEVLYLTPDEIDIDEAYKIFEGLSGLRPQIMQSLLENCNSIKVKRLCLFFAEKSRHAWFKYLDLTKIDLGKGRRSIIKGGVLDKKYNIVIGGIDYEN